MRAHLSAAGEGAVAALDWGVVPERSARSTIDFGVSQPKREVAGDWQDSSSTRLVAVRA